MIEILNIYKVRIKGKQQSNAAQEMGMSKIQTMVEKHTRSNGRLLNEHV